MKPDPSLKQWATETQARYIDAILAHGSIRAAGRAMGVRDTTIGRSLKDLERKASVHGYSPAHDLKFPAAPGFVPKGHSTLYDMRSGEALFQWVKTTRDTKAQEELVRAFVSALMEDIPRAQCEAPPEFFTDDLMSVYPLGDPHFGMYAWAQEAGDDFDLETAERVTKAAIDRLIASSPPSKTGLLLNLGDFFHADNSTNATPQSGHPLDVDTRYAKVMQVGLRSMVYCVKAMLKKHKTVKAWMLPGNHDPHSSFALALCLASYFDQEPRVDVDLSPSLYKYIRFGKVLIGAHHGHGAKMTMLPGIMASDRAEDWGLTLHRYWYCGHIHHKSVDKEHPGVVVETFRTLAARDAWHAGKGYRAGRDMSLIVHHKQFGEIQRTRCDIAMVE